MISLVRQNVWNMVSSYGTRESSSKDHSVEQTAQVRLQNCNQIISKGVQDIQAIRIESQEKCNAFFEGIQSRKQEQSKK